VNPRKPSSSQRQRESALRTAASRPGQTSIDLFTQLISPKSVVENPKVPSQKIPRWHAVLNRNRQLQKQANRAESQLAKARRQRRSLQEKVRRRGARLHAAQSEVERLQNLLESPTSNTLDVLHAFQHATAPVSSASSTLREFAMNIEDNLDVPANARRHRGYLKEFCSLLLDWCGTRTYEFIAKNFQFLPSLRTVQRVIAQDHRIDEGIYEQVVSAQADWIVQQFKQAGYQGPVLLAEDATRCVGEAVWDAKSNALFGFVLGTDTPKPTADSFEAIKQAFQSHPLATYCYCFSLVPFCNYLPAFCLGFFATDNCFTAEDVRKKWKLIRTVLSSKGIVVIAGGSDGDQRLLASQLLEANGGAVSVVKSIQVAPQFGVHEPYFILRPTMPLFPFQDPIHLGLKLLNCIRGPKTMYLGKYFANSTLFHNLRAKMDPLALPFRIRDCSLVDPMNFSSITRLASAETRAAFQQHLPTESAGIVVFLEVCHDFLMAFLHPELSVIERISLLWKTVFFIRMWRAFVMFAKPGDVRQIFITANSFVCIELNAHMFVALVCYLILRMPDCQLFPWLLGSQSLECLFRSLRAMSPCFSVVINFNCLQICHRLGRVQRETRMRLERDHTGMVFPAQR